MKNTVAPSFRSRFVVNLICGIAFGSGSSAYVYLNLSLSFYGTY